MPCRSPARGFSSVLFGLALVVAALLMPGIAAAQAAAPISVASSGQCLDVTGASNAPVAAVIQWPCANGANQLWNATPAGGYHTLQVSHSGQCLDIYAGSTAAGAQAIQYPCHGGANQQFTLRAQGTGYALVARHSGLCLGIEGASTASAARVTQQACTGAAHQTWRLPGLDAASQAGTRGRWSAPQSLSLVPVAAAHLPDGRLLFWSAYDRMNFGGDNGRTYTLTYNPATGSASEVLVSNTGHDMFCPGTANLADGRIHVTGGSSSSRTSVFNPSTGTWSASTPMIKPRGYQGAATLSTGEVFTIGGSWSGGTGNKDGEVWSPSTGQWRLPAGVWDDYILTGDAAGIYRSDNHAWLFASSNGRVFHAGPSRRMNWFDTAAGGVSFAGNRGADAMNGNATMYDVNRILVTGGAPNYENVNATAVADLIDIAPSTPTVTRIAPMAYARAFHNSVVLPTGQVLVVGGQSFPVPFSDDRSVMVPELFDPATRSFSTMATMDRPRNYHSIAMLLADGRVLSAGGGLCGGCATNHPDLQIFSPPYLFKADGSPATRPALTSAPTLASAGSSITVRTDRAVTAFALVRMSSTTHSVNNEQRRVPLTATTTGINQYALALSANRGVLVPGYHMLFAIDSAGVPSVARILRVQ